MDQKLVLTDSSRMTTGHGRVGQNRLLNGVEPHTTGCVRFDPVFSTLRISMNRLRFRFEPKREKNRTELVMCGLGLGLKPRLGLGFARLGLHKIVSPAKSQKAGLAGPGSGSSPGLYSYKANPVNIHLAAAYPRNTPGTTNAGATTN